jgi:hypothetical protein
MASSEAPSVGYVFYRRRAIRALPVAVRVGPLLARHAARALVSAASNSSTELLRSCGLGLALGTPSEAQECLAS